LVIGKRLLFIVAMLLPMMSFSQEKLILKESEGIDLIELMEKRQVFVTRIQDVDIDDNGNLYILDDRSGEVLRIDLKTGSLVNKISSMGQGPTELMMPSVVRVQNKKLYILNVGSGSIKIFSVDGEYLDGFKTQGVPNWMDVDMNGHVYVAEADRDSNPIISVYDIDGKRGKTVVTFRLSNEILNNRGEFFKRQSIKFRIDSGGNIVVLFKMLRELNKFDSTGTLIWQRKISNQTIKPFLKNEGIEYDDQGRPIISYLVNSFDIDRRDNIIVGHVGGGCIYDHKGNLKCVLEVQTIERRNSSPGLRYLKVVGDRLLGMPGGGNAILFPYKLNNNLTSLPQISPGIMGKTWEPICISETYYDRIINNGRNGMGQDFSGLFEIYQRDPHSFKSDIKKVKGWCIDRGITIDWGYYIQKKVMNTA
jgi:hypothetical protein